MLFQLFKNINETLVPYIQILNLKERFMMTRLKISLLVGKSSLRIQNIIKTFNGETFK